MSSAPQSRRIVSISQILAIGDDMRLQNPDLKQTEGSRPRWYIRPYVDKIINGEIVQIQERIYLGDVATMRKREAEQARRKALDVINRRQYVVQAQVNFGDFLDQYEREAVPKLAIPTQLKYTSLIKNHIRPAFGALALAEVTTLRIDAWLSEKERAKKSYSTRLCLKNLMCAIYSKAEDWGYWKEKNPALKANPGRERASRAQRKLTIEQTQGLLAELPADVRLICETALYCTLRISEILGLKWKHIDWNRNMILVRERFYRGDIDTVKSKRSERDVPMGELREDLKRIYPGDGSDELFIFSVQTYVGYHKKPGVCRDDRDINQHFLRPAAQKLGLYWKGFGFHAFRREAVTEHGKTIGANQAQRMAGHSRADMSLHYTLSDQQEQDRAVRNLQDRVRSKKVVEIKRGA